MTLLELFGKQNHDMCPGEGPREAIETLTMDWTESIEPRESCPAPPSKTGESVGLKLFTPLDSLLKPQDKGKADVSSARTAPPSSEVGRGGIPLPTLSKSVLKSLPLPRKMRDVSLVLTIILISTLLNALRGILALRRSRREKSRSRSR